MSKYFNNMDMFEQTADFLLKFKTSEQTEDTKRLVFNEDNLLEIQHFFHSHYLIPLEKADSNEPIVLRCTLMQISYFLMIQITEAHLDFRPLWKVIHSEREKDLLLSEKKEETDRKFSAFHRFEGFIKTQRNNVFPFHHILRRKNTFSGSFNLLEDCLTYSINAKQNNKTLKRESVISLLRQFTERLEKMTSEDMTEANVVWLFLSMIYSCLTYLASVLFREAGNRNFEALQTGSNLWNTFHAHCLKQGTSFLTTKIEKELQPIFKSKLREENKSSRPSFFQSLFCCCSS